MRTRIRGVGAALPLVEIGKTVFVGVLIENVGVFDVQTVFFKPFIWDRRMHLGILQRGRQAVWADEMSFRNEKSRARAGLSIVPDSRVAPPRDRVPPRRRAARQFLREAAVQ